ncbi:MAG: hypothetical protein HYS08_10755 [Chlamydiae bacterium]|nr:hypothetical protein [Chlamydiota bacterium]MBI3266604.1 hypothetical protein [Chlamydiota bacterium]
MRKTLVMLCVILGMVSTMGKAADEKLQHQASLVTLDFKEADLENVLRLLSDQYGVNVVAGEEVHGKVTVHLENVTMEGALKAILGANGYGYVSDGNIFRVAPLAQLADEEKTRKELEGYEGVVSEVILLHYLDAQDAKKVLRGLLSSHGLIKVLERKTLPGWQITGVAGGTGFSSSTSSSTSGTYSNMANISNLVGKRTQPVETYERSRTLLITDTSKKIQLIKEVLEKLDVPPQQVMIDAMVVELALSNTEDLGLRWDSLEGWEISAAPSRTLTDEFTKKADSSDDLSSSVDEGLETSRVRTINNLSGNASSDVTTKTGETTTATTETHDASHSKSRIFTDLRSVVLSADELKVVLSALAKKGDVDVISSPNVLTLDNHEATILVGENFPIFTTSVSDQGTVTESFDYYQPVGISLRVIPQVSAHSHINMLIHPSISEIGEFVTGTTGLKYPRINIREADTQVLIQEGQTVVIGGLVTGRDEEVVTRVPFLGDIPILGLAFRHKSIVKKKVNLLVFVTPRLVKPDEISEQESRVFKYYLKYKKIQDEKKRAKPKKFFSPPF